METEDKDPELWTVEDVKQWAESTFPFGIALAKAIVENDVDGSILFNHITEETLKSDLNIRSLGQRVKILERISGLRRIGLATESDKLQNRRISLPLPVTQFTPPFRLHDLNGRTRISVGAERHLRLPSDLSMSPFPCKTVEYSLKRNADGVFMHDVTGTPNSIYSKFKAERRQYTPLTPQTPTNPWTSVEEHTSSLRSPLSLDNVDFPNEDQGEEVVPDIQQEDETEDGKEYMEIPQPLPPIPVDPHQIRAEKPSKRRRLNPQYFRSREFRAAEVMFTPEGEESHRSNLSIDNPSNPAGERLYVQGLMRKLLQDPDIIEFVHNDTQRTVWKLHSEKYLKKHEQHTALVFDTTSDGCNLFRGSVGTLGIPEQPARRPRKSKERTERFRWDEETNPFETGDDWGYLEKWKYMEDDKILPVFLESDSEDGEYDHATIREMEMEKRQKNGEAEAVAKPISVDQVKKIMEEELERFERRWMEKELPKWTARAYRIYRKYDRSKTKKSKAARCRGQMDQITERIDGCKGEYKTIQWKSAPELRRMCANLQESVNSLQELRWHIELLTGPRPEKPVKPTETKSDQDAAKEVVNGNFVDDQAVLSGEDEDEEMEDDMDGFIVDDEDMDAPLPEDELGFGDMGEIDNDEEDVDIEGNDAEETMVHLSPSRSRRKMRIFDSEDEGGDQEEPIVNYQERQKTAEELDLKSDNEMEDLKPSVLPTPVTSDVNSKPDKGGSARNTKAVSKRGLHSERQDTDFLPTPPQEPDEDPQSDANCTVKQEHARNAPTTQNELPDPVGYDSDIFCSFGDLEISEFCQCTERSATVAKDYLKKADGDTSRAISFYLEDMTNDRVTEPVQSKRQKTKTKKFKKAREVVRLDDESEDDDVNDRNAADITTFMKPPLNSVLPRDDTLQAVKNLVSDVPPDTLHDSMKEIALLAKPKFDSTGQFLVGETLENCAAYWKIYLAYMQDLFGEARARKLADWSLERIRHPQRFNKFYDRLCSYLAVRYQQRRNSPTEDQIPQSSQLTDLQSSPIKSKEEKKRKKHKKDKPAKVKAIKPITKSAEQKSQEAELKRIADRERVRQKKGQFVTTTATGEIIINQGKKVKEYTVCLHPDLAKVMKPHQIEGVRFMWLQTVMMTTGRGCLLAHAMGLGKTLQIIAFLITLASLPPEAYKNLDMPDHLNFKKLNRDVKRFMVVCPPSIVVNWANEFEKWTPADCKDALGRIHCVNDIAIEDRVETIRKWYRRGGVLLIGYSQLRALLGSKKLSEDDAINVQEWLLDPGADVVVADEAHMIKNDKSKIGGLLNRIRTRSRIATTGSPLSNNLKEYWTMMNWIHRDFLGTLRSFTAEYIVPIQAGLYAESSLEERKLSQRRLVSLKTVLNGKLHRQDISAIQADLPSKSEFIVHLPLSPLQQKLYEALLNSGFERHTQLFKWINILRLICNHPYTLWYHIGEQAKKEQAKNEDQGQERRKNVGRSVKIEKTVRNEEFSAPSHGSSPDPEPEDPEDTEAIPPVSELQWATDIFANMGEQRQTLKYTNHGNKARLVKHIVHEAVKLRDNVLIFVHSIPTLEFLDSMLRHKKHRIYILCGKTKMKDRQDDIDRFNEEIGAVYLISAKAGSLGLNITSANRVILYDLAWNPVHDQQAVGRAYRYGQKKHVFVYRLGTYGTYENIFFQENIFKLNLSKRVIDKHNPGRFGNSRDRDIRKYFQPPKEISEAEPIDRELFAGKDQVLDKLLELSDQGDDPKIVELDLSETFHKDEEETYLTAEDARAANEEAEKERELREAGQYDYSKYAWASSQVHRGIAMDLFPDEFDFFPGLAPLDDESPGIMKRYNPLWRSNNGSAQESAQKLFKAVTGVSGI